MKTLKWFVVNIVFLSCIYIFPSAEAQQLIDTSQMGIHPFGNKSNDQIQSIQVYTGSISGIKFYDENGNTFRDPETDYGMAGWGIKITVSKIDSTYTDVNENHTFSDLPNGTYTAAAMVRWEG